MQQRIGVGSFARDYAGSDAESIAELYRRRDELRAVPHTVKRYLAEGSVEKAREVEHASRTGSRSSAVSTRRPKL